MLAAQGPLASACGLCDRCGQLPIPDVHLTIAREDRDVALPGVPDVGHHRLGSRLLGVRVRLLGATAALVTCLWDQSQTADGQGEHATGRLTIVYQKIGADWKIVHTHTSPDKPSPSNLLPSETTNGADSTTKPPTKP